VLDEVVAEDVTGDDLVDVENVDTVLDVELVEGVEVAPLIVALNAATLEDEADDEVVV